MVPDKRVEIDPWGNTLIEDYTRLYRMFGVVPFKKFESKFKKPHRFIRRGIIFGHRDFGRIFDAIKKKLPWAVLSGIKPTGEFHLGSLTTATEIVYFQKLGGQAFYCIADIEAYEDNGIPLDKSRETAIANLADILALGLNHKKAYIYRQSEEKRVINLTFEVARSITLNMLKDIYGIRSIGLYMASMVQIGDILLPQHKDFGGKKPTVIPVGIDQDPHIRLSRDVARKFNMILPSATLHKLAIGLDGTSKMGKRNPMSYFTFNEPINKIKEKVMNAFTGGRATAEEQRRLGGRPDICPIYDMCKFHLMTDDKDMIDLYHECSQGIILCGECKSKRFELLSKVIVNHNKKKLKFLDLAREILDKE